MRDNVYLIEIIYMIFYAFLILFIYFNAVAIMNFSESNKIIIENASPYCVPNIKDMKFIDASALGKCTLPQNEGKFFYSIPKSNLNFIVTKDEKEAGNFFAICKNYCPGGSQNIEAGRCKSKNSVPFDNCIKLLQPPPNCTNPSAAIAVDKDGGTFIYAFKKSQTGIKTC